jgi:hypothetical protein
VPLDPDLYTIFDSRIIPGQGHFPIARGTLPSKIKEDLDEKREARGLARLTDLQPEGKINTSFWLWVVF